MIALATLAALGEALHAAEIDAAIAAGALVLASLAFVAAIALPRGRQRWEPRQLHSALHGPPSATEEELMKAIGEQGRFDDEDGSGQ